MNLVYGRACTDVMLKKKAMHEMQLITSRDLNLGDLVWVQLHCSSWWLAQAVDENSVSGIHKPRYKSAGEVLVRLYGSYKYLYVDPIMFHGKFEDKLEAYSGNYMDILKEALKQELNCLRSSSSEKKLVKNKEFATDEESRGSIPKKNITNKSQDTTTLHCKSRSNHKEVRKRPRPGDLSHASLYAPSNKRSSAQKARNSIEKSNELLNARRIKVMQTLGLVAPSGSPFYLKSWTHFSEMEYL
ncbi:PWWP domain-containing protein [Abeliophyllum distichum]|uniref:PWWP domain-containing protein n=1 Tax=Abeliophyllum distichum TaxID=126358 RepID=A0ABD1SBU6_9LAMI